MFCTLLIIIQNVLKISLANFRSKLYLHFLRILKTINKKLTIVNIALITNIVLKNKNNQSCQKEHFISKVVSRCCNGCAEWDTPRRHSPNISVTKTSGYVLVQHALVNIGLVCQFLYKSFFKWLISTFFRYFDILKESRSIFFSLEPSKFKSFIWILLLCTQN